MKHTLSNTEMLFNLAT